MNGKGNSAVQKKNGQPSPKRSRATVLPKQLTVPSASPLRATQVVIHFKSG